MASFARDDPSRQGAKMTHRCQRCLSRSKCCHRESYGVQNPTTVRAKQRPEQKIDAAVALMMAVGRTMVADNGQADILEFLRNPISG